MLGPATRSELMEQEHDISASCAAMPLQKAGSACGYQNLTMLAAAPVSADPHLQYAERGTHVFAILLVRVRTANYADASADVCCLPGTVHFKPAMILST